MAIDAQSQRVIGIAEHCYLFDPKFHARANQVALVLDAHLRDKTGQRMTKEDHALAVHAASVALVIAQESTGLVF